MVKRTLFTLTSLFAVAFIMLGFQNCGESLDLSQQNLNSEAQTTETDPVGDTFIPISPYEVSPGVFEPAGFKSANDIDYLIRTYPNDTIAGQISTADNYCKALLGPNSNYISYELEPEFHGVQNFAYTTSEAICDSHPYDVGYTGTHCLVSFPTPTLNFKYFTNVTCSVPVTN